MHSLTLDCTQDEKDELLGRLWELDTAGVTENDLTASRVSLRAFFDEPFDSTEFAAFDPQWAEEPDTDWQAESEAAWPGRPVGERLFIAPPWCQEPTPPGRERVVINPGVAFGTGADTTTQLALEILERTVQPGDRVFDFGTGSGILALAALRLGAAAVHGCDIDHDAIVAARADMPAEIGLFTGSLRSIESHWADVIFANINAETVSHNAEEMKRVLKPGGRLIVGGIPPRHAERVIKALSAQQWTLRERVDRDIWVCMSWHDKGQDK